QLSCTFIVITCCASCAILFPYTPLFLSSPGTQPTVVHTLSLHDALPICSWEATNFGSPDIARCSHVTWLRSRLLSTSTIRRWSDQRSRYLAIVISSAKPRALVRRSEEHTSELQSPDHLVCRLLLEKKK